MFKTKQSCPKCGNIMVSRWEEGEKSSGMDIEPLKPSGMRSTCIGCGYSELEAESTKLS